MRKLLLIILTLTLVVGLIGCNKEKAVSYEFEYKFKEEYSKDVSRELGIGFIEIIKKTEFIYENVLDLEDVSAEKSLMDYMEDEYAPTLKKLLDDVKENSQYKSKDQDLMDFLLRIFETAEKLGSLKGQYISDKKNEEIGIEVENDLEYYKESSKNFKKRFEEILEDAKIFIN